MSIVFSDGMGAFPEVHYADENGLLCIGATLAPDRLIFAYHNGIFPWYSEGEPICWYAPPERLVLFPECFKVTKSFKTFLNTHNYNVTVNKDFTSVINNCAKVARANQDGTWIVQDMIDAYEQLYRLGFVMSIEVWEEDNLVGGLYGVNIGKVFCGESMFSHKSNASKLALYHLCTNFDFKMIDCQVETQHLLILGAELISRDTFMEYLESLVE